MDINFKCLKCEQHIAVDETGAGWSVDCPKCGQKLTVPQKTSPTTVNKPSKVEFKACPNCGKDVFSTDASCVHCGKPLSGTSNFGLKPSIKDGKITFECERCHQVISVDFAMSGKLLSCPKCEGWICAPKITPPVPDCIIAQVLTFIAVLDFVGAVILGYKIGATDESPGWIVFFSCVGGGILVLGFAYVLKYLHEIAYWLRSGASTHSITGK